MLTQKYLGASLDQSSEWSRLAALLYSPSSTILVQEIGNINMLTQKYLGASLDQSSEWSRLAALLYSPSSTILRKENI
jgi:hypothetical protein